MTTVSAVGISSKKLEDFIDTQKADLVLAKFKELLGADLTRCGMQISPQGISYKVVDVEQLMMVPHKLQQKILVKNHDVPVVGYMGINRTMGLIIRAY